MDESKDFPYFVWDDPHMEKLKKSSSIKNFPLLQKTAKQFFLRQSLINELIQLINEGRCIILSGREGTGRESLLKSIFQVSDTLPPIAKVSVSRIEGHLFYAYDLANYVRNLFDSSKQKAYIFIPDFHRSITAGNYSENPSYTLANVLLPYLDSKTRIIGKATPEQIAYMESRNRTFMNAFALVNVPSMDEDETLHALKFSFSSISSMNTHNLFASEDREQEQEKVLKLVVDFSKKYFPHLALPGAAFLVAKELHNSNMENWDRSFVENIIIKKTGLNKKLVQANTSLSKIEVVSFFKKYLFGQEEAIERVSSLILKIKSNICAEGRPKACFLFVGPTGSGKTELSKLISKFLFTKDNLLRVDMGEMITQESISKLLGFKEDERRSYLLREVRENPFSVILLDEIEKCHPQIFALLLQILDEGRAVDIFYEMSFFSNTIIIMTSNLGSHLYNSRSGLLNEITVSEDEIKAEVERYFAPEFINRIDDIIVFNPLSKDDCEKIVKKEIGIIRERKGIVERGLTFEFDDAFINCIVKLGFSEQYGARAIQRTLEEHFVSVLAEKISSGELQDDSSILVSANNGKIVFSVRALVKEGRLK